MNLRLRPIPIWSKQQEFRQSKAWIRGFFAGRGAGKTKIGAIDILRRSRAGDPCMAIAALTHAKSARWENLPWALNSHNS